MLCLFGVEPDDDKYHPVKEAGPLLGPASLSFQGDHAPASFDDAELQYVFFSS
jgi:hypothetical protein